jgi:DNA-directed RNA polymerase subunit RPC12/RpoP
MKTNKFFLSLATVMVCVSSVFISCSSDDDDNNSSKELGDKAVEELQSRLLDDEGNVIFGEANGQGYYDIGMETQADAQKLVGQYAKNYDGNAATYTYTLPDARGTVRVDKGDVAGVYYNVKFAVTGIPQMTLQVVEPNYMEGENKIKILSTYVCNDCGASFKLPNKAAKVCPSCGKTNIEKP